LARRWRFWACFQDDDREEKAREEIGLLKRRGFGAKVWAPLPEHKTSGHIHIVILSTFDQLCDLAGITDYLNRKE
jgi:hypothetical protein